MKRFLVGASGAEKLCTLGAMGRFCAAPTLLRWLWCKSLWRISGVAAMLLCLVVVSPEVAGRGAAAGRLDPGVHEVTLDGVRFAYFVAGRGPLLIVQCPGWGIGSEYLRNGLAPLQQNFTMVFYDTRGSGDSSRPQDASTIRVSQFAEDLERLRQYWGLQKLRLLGHSWGGGIALAYALRHPQHTGALVLVDSSIPGFDYSEIHITLHDQWIAAKGDSRLSAAMTSMEADEPVHTDEEFKAKLHRNLPYYFFDPVAGPDRFWQTYHGTPAAWTWNAWHANFDKDEEQLLNGKRPDSIRVPTLIIYGREDRICPVVMAWRLHTWIDRSTLRILDDSGHLPWIETPTPFFAAVVGFLR